MLTPHSSLRRTRTGPLLVLAAVLLLSLAACDSGGSEPQPADVAGVYSFTELTFDITARNFPDVNVLDTLQSARLILESSGTYLLIYQFAGADDDVVVGGMFSVTENRVRINADEEDRPFFNDILLPPELALRRSETALATDVPRTVNLQDFNPSEYLGLESVGGTLHIQLVE